MSRRRTRADDSGVSGCAIVDKPAGCTSHDVIDQLRRAFGTRKVGHAGTLDPNATGVLVVGVGQGTKLLQFITGVDKTYTTEIIFGAETPTLDADSDVITTYQMDLDPVEVTAKAQSFVGQIEQIPPMVSAVKVDGKRLHELAREGKEVERKARPVTVYRYDVDVTDDPMVYKAEIRCSSGTYVRTLAADLGVALGGGAYIQNLRRTAVGPYGLDQAEPLDRVTLRPVADLVSHLATITVEDELARQVSYGASLGPTGGSGLLAVQNQSGDLLAIYEARDGELRPAKVLVAA